MKTLAFIYFFIILYTQGLLSTIGIPKIVVETLLLVIPVFILLDTKRAERLAPGWIFVLLYAVWSVMACFYNGEGIIRGLLFARYLVIGYIVLWAAWNSNFSERQIRRINNAIFIMFFIQVVTALYEILFIGRTESIVGIMFSGGGSPATVFPMFAFSFMFAFFLYRNRIIYLVAGCLFFIVGYASGKLGIYFLIPALSIIGILMYWKLAGIRIVKYKITSLILYVFLLTLIIFSLIPHATSRTEHLNLEQTTISERFQIFWEFSKRGEFAKGGGKYTGSRTATSLRIIEETFKRSPLVFLFGHGTSAYRVMEHSRTGPAFEEYGIVYGITGWSYDALCIGWPGMFFHIGLLLMLFINTLKVIRNERLASYWRIITFATLLNFFTFLLNYVFYSYSFTVGGWMIYTHAYFTGIILAPQYRKILLGIKE
jgi:hypothetical protein